MSRDRRQDIVLTAADVDRLRGVLNGCYAALRDVKRAYGMDDDFPTHADDAYEELGDFMYPSDGVEPVLPTCGEKLDAWLDGGPPEPLTVDAKSRSPRSGLNSGD